MLNFIETCNCPYQTNLVERLNVWQKVHPQELSLFSQDYSPPATIINWEEKFILVHNAACIIINYIDKFKSHCERKFLRN
jgi:hypothetical protein